MQVQLWPLHWLFIYSFIRCAPGHCRISLVGLRRIKYPTSQHPLNPFESSLNHIVPFQQDLRTTLEDPAGGTARIQICSLGHLNTTGVNT
uniref:Secreted protein n=1 Tax=Hordeum vulgare subsp. vulgare TaxID=112509 RepID=A0A8I6XMS9_HORVV